MSPRRRFLTRLALVAAAGFVIRLWYTLAERRHTKPTGDDFYYHWQAELLARGHGFVDPWAWELFKLSRPGAFHPPLYTVYLAMFSKLGFGSVLEHRIASCLLGAACVFVIGLVAARIASPRAGLIAAGIAAVFPNLWINDANLMSESLYALTIAVVLLCAYRYWQVPCLGSAVVLGAACAVAALTRAEALALFPLLVLPLVCLSSGPDRTRPTWATRIKWTAAAGLVGVLLIAPWVGANLVRFIEPETITSGSGQVLALGNCDATYHGEFIGYWHTDCAIHDFPPGCRDVDLVASRAGRPVPDCDESSVEVKARKMGREYMFDNLDRLPVVMTARIGRAFDVYAPFQGARFNEYFESRGELPPLWGLWGYWIALGFAIVGSVDLARRKVTLIPMGAIVVMTAVTAAASFGITRYRVPVDVCVVVLAGTGIDWLLRGRRRTPEPERAIRVSEAVEVPA